MFDLFLKGLKDGFCIVLTIIFAFLLVVLVVFPAWLAITYSWWWTLFYIIVVPFIIGVANIVFSF